MKAVRTWVVIADGGRARFLINNGPGKGLTAMPERTMEGETAATHELGTERPGRVHDRFGAARHAMAPRVDWHAFEKAKFAKGVARILDRAAEKDAFDRLVLVAPAKALGQIRQALGKNAAGRITGEAAKDITNLDDRALPDHLGDLLAL